MPTSELNPFSLTPVERSFNLSETTTQLMTDLTDPAPLLALNSRCLQLATLLDLSFKGVDVQIVSHLNQACLRELAQNHEL